MMTMMIKRIYKKSLDFFVFESVIKTKAVENT